MSPHHLAFALENRRWLADVTWARREWQRRVALTVELESWLALPAREPVRS